MGSAPSSNLECTGDDTTDETKTLQWLIQIPFQIFFAILLIVKIKWYTELNVFSLNGIKFIILQSMAIAAGFTSIISTYIILNESSYSIYDDDGGQAEDTDGFFWLFLFLWSIVNILVLLGIICSSFKRNLDEDDVEKARKKSIERAKRKTIQCIPYTDEPWCCNKYVNECIRNSYCGTKYKIFRTWDCGKRGNALFSSVIMFGLKTMFEPLVEYDEIQYYGLIGLENRYYCSRNLVIIQQGIIPLVLAFLVLIPMLFACCCWHEHKQKTCCCFNCGANKDGCCTIFWFTMFNFFFYFGAVLGSALFIFYKMDQLVQDLEKNIKIPMIPINVFILLTIFVAILYVLVAVYLCHKNMEQDQEKNKQEMEQSMPTKGKLKISISTRTPSKNTKTPTPNTNETPSTENTNEIELMCRRDTNNNNINNNNNNGSVLPNGWSVRYTTDGRPYYQNEITHQTQWEQPEPGQ